MSDAFGRAVGNLYRGGPANVSWEQALEGLSPGDAARTPAGLPHSVAQVVAHVQFWQVFLLDAVRGQGRAMPPHAAQGWPAPGPWDALRADFLRDADALRALARDPAAMSVPDDRGHPLAVNFTNFAGHGVYHLGQVVLIRQALGLWPPPGGGDTW